MRVHDPVGEAAQALALGAHPVGEDFAEVDPDDRALREGEEGDEADQQPDQQVLVLAGEEDERRRRPGRRPCRPAPMSSSFLRPTRSITDMAIMVKSRLVAPMATACRSPETLLKPAWAKMSFR